jgi:outer membrane protein assembly factor BamB
MIRTLLAGCVAVACAWGHVARAEDWPAFRGAAGDGVAAEQPVPLEWGPGKNVKWRAPLEAPGNSSPIVSRAFVFVSGPNADGKQRGLHCFDRQTGKLLWSKWVAYDQPDPTHGTNPYCSSTPAADGNRVVVWHGSAGLSCYDYAGKLLWSRDLGLFKHIWGYGSSPRFHGKKILLNCGPGERTFVTAINAGDGKTIWQADEPGGATGEKGSDEWIGSWSTPVVARIDGREQVLVSLPHHLKAYDAEEGTLLWSCDGLGKLVYTSPLIGEGLAVAMSGYHGPAMACRLGGRGNVTETNRLWRAEARIPQRIGSGMIVGNHVYMANEQFIAQCFDVTTGEELWQSRMPAGVIWSSLVRVGDRLYVTNQNGNTIVFRASPRQFELLAENKLEEACNATLAVADGQIFVRTHQALYCIEDPALPKKRFVTPPPPPQKPVNFREPKRVFERVAMGRWQISVEKQLLDEAPDLAKKALSRLERKLDEALSLLPETSHERIRSLALFLMYGPKADGGGRDNGLEYFQKSAADHDATLDPAWKSAVVIYSAENYAALSELWALKALVHEFGHAQQLEQFPEDQPHIVAAWQNAVAKGLYQNVEDESGNRIEKAYALTNQLEYFAELSCMYFARCNYRPFHRAELKEYDPAGYDMIERIWGIKEADWQAGRPPAVWR